MPEPMVRKEKVVQDCRGAAPFSKLVLVNVVRDASGLSPTGRRPWADGIVDAFGSDRNMWASDWPLAGESASHAHHLALVRQLPFLDERAQRWIVEDTAGLFWRPQPG